MQSDKTFEFTGPPKGPQDPADVNTVPCLVVLSGPEQGALFPLEDGEEFSVGRAVANSIVLTEPGISRSHANFRLTGHSIEVEDLGSTNGTFVNGVKTTKASVKAGDTLGFGGRTSVRLSFQDAGVSNVLAGLYKDAALDGSGVLTVKALTPRLKASSDHSLAVVEIDQLAQLRDRFGHRAEEELVSHVASVLKNGLVSHGLVARLSGEGFLVNLNRRAVEAEEILQGVRQAIEFNHFRVDTSSGPEFTRVTVSIGVATFIEESDYEASLAAAEEALKMAKAMGRNRVSVSDRKMFGRS